MNGAITPELRVNFVKKYADTNLIHATHFQGSFDQFGVMTGMYIVERTDGVEQRGDFRLACNQQSWIGEHIDEDNKKKILHLNFYLGPTIFGFGKTSGGFYAITGRSDYSAATLAFNMTVYAKKAKQARLFKGSFSNDSRGLMIHGLWNKPDADQLYSFYMIVEKRSDPKPTQTNPFEDPEFLDFNLPPEYSEQGMRQREQLAMLNERLEERGVIKGLSTTQQVLSMRSLEDVSRAVERVSSDGQLETETIALLLRQPTPQSVVFSFLSKTVRLVKTTDLGTLEYLLGLCQTDEVKLCLLQGLVRHCQSVLNRDQAARILGHFSHPDIRQIIYSVLKVSNN